MTSPYDIASPIWKLPNLISKSNISAPKVSDSELNAPVCVSICASAPDVSPLRNSPSLRSLPLKASGVSVSTSPVKSVRNPSVLMKNLGKSTVTVGKDVNPVPPSVMFISVMTPRSTTAVPNAPVPPPPVTLADTRL